MSAALSFESCIENFFQSFQQQSKFHAYKILDASCKNLQKVSGILQKHVKRKISMQLHLRESRTF